MFSFVNNYLITVFKVITAAVSNHVMQARLQEEFHLFSFMLVGLFSYSNQVFVGVDLSFNEKNIFQ